jgi:predicted enzyme related to lactoylglutathione lyase
MPGHPIVHVDFPSTDPAAAGEFYGSIFGWEIVKSDAMNYVMFSSEAWRGGGFPAADGTMKAGTPIVYVETDDIDATLAKVEALGGKTLMPKGEIPGNGWMALFSDPSGNPVGLYTPPAQA